MSPTRRVRAEAVSEALRGTDQVSFIVGYLTQTLLSDGVVKLEDFEKAIAEARRVRS